jgi:hypothetical protein
MGRQMKVLLILALVILAAATAVAAYSGVEMAMTSAKPTEPAQLLFYGSALLGLGGVVRRFTF